MGLVSLAPVMSVSFFLKDIVIAYSSNSAGFRQGDEAREMEKDQRK